MKSREADAKGKKRHSRYSTAHRNNYFHNSNGWPRVGGRSRRRFKSKFQDEDQAPICVFEVRAQTKTRVSWTKVKKEWKGRIRVSVIVRRMTRTKDERMNSSDKDQDIWQVEA